MPRFWREPGWEYREIVIPLGVTCPANATAEERRAALEQCTELVHRAAEREALGGWRLRDSVDWERWGEEQRVRLLEADSGWYLEAVTVVLARPDPSTAGRYPTSAPPTSPVTPERPPPPGGRELGLIVGAVLVGLSLMALVVGGIGYLTHRQAEAARQQAILAQLIDPCRSVREAMLELGYNPGRGGILIRLLYDKSWQVLHPVLVEVAYQRTLATEPEALRAHIRARVQAVMQQQQGLYSAQDAQRALQAMESAAARAREARARGRAAEPGDQVLMQIMDDPDLQAAWRAVSSHWTAISSWPAAQSRQRPREGGGFFVDAAAGVRREFGRGAGLAECV